MIETHNAAAARTFVSKVFSAWLRIFLGFSVLALLVGAIEGVRLVIDREVTWAELPAFLLRATPPLLLLALQASIGLLVVIVVFVGPIVWLSRRSA